MDGVCCVSIVLGNRQTRRRTRYFRLDTITHWFRCGKIPVIPCVCRPPT
jgi:hypothetical protein